MSSKWCPPSSNWGEVTLLVPNSEYCCVSTNGIAPLSSLCHLSAAELRKCHSKALLQHGYSNYEVLRVPAQVQQSYVLQHSLALRFIVWPIYASAFRRKIRCKFATASDRNCMHLLILLKPQRIAKPYMACSSRHYHQKGITLELIYPALVDWAMTFLQKQGNPTSIPD